MKNEGDIRLSIKQARRLHVLEEVTGGVITSREASALSGLSMDYIRRRKTDLKEVKVVSLSDGPMVLRHKRTFYKPAKSAEKTKKKILADANTEPPARGKTGEP